MEKSAKQIVAGQKQPYVRPELRKQGRIEEMTQGNTYGISQPVWK